MYAATARRQLRRRSLRLRIVQALVALAGCSLVVVQAATAQTAGEPAVSVAAPMRVNAIHLRGNRVVTDAQLQAAAASYVGRDLSAADVEQLRILLTRQYTDRGYINSGVVLDSEHPYQDGVLSFRVIEGRITAVRTKGLKRLRRAYVVSRLRHGDDETLNINVLRERFQRLLDDPLFAHINSSVIPGDQPGESVLDIDVTRARPYEVSAAFNNYRPPSIGEKGYDVGGLVRDLTGWGDVLDGDISGPIGKGGGVNYTVGWQVPFTRYYTQLALRTSFSDTVVAEEPLAELDIRSRIRRHEIKLTQPLWATLQQQFNVSLGVAYESDRTSLAGLPFSFLPGADDNGLTRAISVRLAPDYSYRTENQFVGLRLTALHVNLLGEPHEPAFFVQPDNNYWVWLAQGHHLYEWAKSRLEFETRLTAQWTGSRISDLHALQIGGVESVRGFRENELLLANVTSLNFDFRWLAFRQANSFSPALTVGTFFDWASGYDAGEPRSTLSSTGLTLRLKWAHLQADLAYGTHLIHPAFVDQEHGSWQDHGIHAQIATSL